MGLSCFRAISGWVGLGMGWDLCAGLLYEHRFAMLITKGPEKFISQGLHNETKSVLSIRESYSMKKSSKIFTNAYGQSLSLSEKGPILPDQIDL